MVVPAAAAAAAAAVAAVIEGEVISRTSAHYRYLDGIQGRSDILLLNVCCYIGYYCFCFHLCIGPWVFILYMHSSPYTAPILNIYLLASIPVIRNRQATAFKSDGGVICDCIFLPLACDGHGVISGVISGVELNPTISYFKHIACQHKHICRFTRIYSSFILGLKSLQVDLIVKFEGEYNFRPVVYLLC